MPCRTCGAPLRGFEVIADGGGAIHFTPTAAVLKKLEIDATFDGTGPRWLCRYLDGYPCFDCETVDLAVVDVRLLLECEGKEFPQSDWTCPACACPCLGPRPLESDGAAGRLLAFLKHKYGAPLDGRLCPSCGRVYLSLHPDDSVARKELAERFPASGPCPSCRRGRRRVTRLDAPYCGYVALREPSHDGKEGRRVAGLLVAVCDSCGEASTHPEPPGRAFQ